MSKKLSILGDSVSTYKDVSNDASANSTTFYNPYYYKMPLPLEKTYWMLVMKELNLTLCVNNSWSGGNLSGRDNPDSGVNRANHLAHNDGTLPDVIIVFMGLNDLGRNVPVDTFYSDYEHTLKTIKQLYPNALVCCVNLPDRESYFKKRTEIFNSAIEKAVSSAGDNFFVANLFESKLNNDFYYINTLDGLHPDADGMKFIAEVVEEAISKKLS